MSSEGPEVLSYGVRKCRGHWHVTTPSGDDDLWFEGDPFPTREAAIAAAKNESIGNDTSHKESELSRVKKEYDELKEKYDSLLVSYDILLGCGK